MKMTNIAPCKAGATAIEYGLILSLLVILVMVAIENLGGETAAMWNGIATKSSNAIAAN